MKTVQQEYEQAVLGGDTEKALLIIQHARFRHAPLDIYDQVLVPTQNTIGILWHDKKLSIAEEHHASQITSAAMCFLRQTPYVCLPLGCSAVVSTLANEQHEFGARAFSDCLQFDGWSVHYLGPDTPATELYDYASQHQIDLLAVSITKSESKDELKKLHERVTNNLSGPALLVGGSASLPLQQQLEPHARFAFADSFREGLTSARKLVGVLDPDKNLERTLAVLGKGLKALRKQKDLSQQQLASLSGIDRTYLSMLESGKQNPSISVLAKLASVLEISVPELLCSHLLLPKATDERRGSHPLMNSKRRMAY